MKLLFDEDISPRFVAGLANVLPGSVHVRVVGLDRATDAAIWSFALHLRPHYRLEGLRLSPDELRKRSNS